MSAAAPTPSLSRLWGVVARNPGYRRLFLATVVSQAGDWLSVVALMDLMLRLTGSGESVAMVLLCRTLPVFVAGPLAGWVADRFSRRTTLVACDLARFFVTLGLLFVDRAERVPLALALIALHSFISAFYETAQLALFPHLVEPEDLPVASALENTLWATMLAVGSMVGGLLLPLVGRNATFVIDALTFLVSAALLSGLPEPVRSTRDAEEEPAGLSGLLEGLRWLKGEPGVAWLLVVKGMFGLTLGGVLVLLPFFAEQVFGAGEGRGLATLYTARGIGSFLGPLVAWRLSGDTQPALRRGIAAAFGGLVFAYACFSQAPSLAFAACCLALGNACGSVLWTWGSTLQQQLVPDRVRGRVFAADMGWMTLVMTFSSLSAGRLLDAGFTPRQLIALFGGLALLPLTLWLRAQRHFPDGEAAVPVAPQLRPAA